MTSYIISDKMLKIYTNKNSSVFKRAADEAYSSLPDGKYGIVYDDFNPDMTLYSNWKTEGITCFHVATRGKSLHMDSKILFQKARMNASKYTPQGFYKIEEVTDKDALYFVKKNGSTGSKGVNIYDYDSLQNVGL